MCFCVVLSYPLLNTICDLHQGYSSLKFEIAMESEHCTKNGCMEKFRTSNRTSNYSGFESYPKKEWEVIVQGTRCPEEEMRFNRRIPNISDLCELPLTKKAKLEKAEVIAVVMYTGPMVSMLLRLWEVLMQLPSVCRMSRLSIIATL